MNPTPPSPPVNHPWSKAITLLQHQAQDDYQCYEKLTKDGLHDYAKRSYDTYVELNTAAQFLAHHKPSGVLELPNADNAGIGMV